jgi:hypothetical protein
MNLDDFEARLGRQPLRPVPPAWRDAILDSSRPSTLNPQPSTSWRSWLWPSPVAWAGLAATWVVILALNHAAAPQLSATGPRFAGSINSYVLFTRLAEETGLLSETPTAPPAAERPRRAIPGPRSDVPRRILSA